MTHFPDAYSRIRAAAEARILKRNGWGNGTDAVCMMSAMVQGADHTDVCVTAGWPLWLVDLNVHLFDSDVGSDDEDDAAITFALDVAQAVSRPFDADRARDLFLIARLDTGDHSALKSLRLNPVDAEWWRNCESAIIRVVDLLRRRLAGDDVSAEMNAAHFAAADAAAGTVDYAAYAAYADYAARAAYAAADAAYAAAYAAARRDLIDAITKAGYDSEGMMSGWKPIDTAPDLERVLVAGWQPNAGGVSGYWWYYEDVTDENGVPIDHPNATMWMRWPEPPRYAPWDQ